MSGQLVTSHLPLCLIFDCDFVGRSVQYIHNGSPLLTSDTVKLLVHKFTGTRTYTEPVTLRVHVRSSSQDVVTLGLRSLVVPELNGLSNVIDASTLRFHYSSSQNVSCVVGFSTFFSPWPLVGQMVSGERRRVVDSLKKDCREFLFMNLHYEHLRSPTPDVDYLPLTVELYDPAVSDEVVSERFYLPVHIKGAFPNSPPHASFINMYMMDVDQFVLSTIIPGVISAEDYETPKRDLVFNISKPFGEGKGHLVHLDNHAQPISSFLQDDLDNHRVAYRPPSVAYPDQRVHEAEFTVYDSHFAASLPITLHVAVRPSDTSAPRVSVNTGLTLLEGQSRTITTDHFQVVDKDNIDRVRIYVKGGLQHGTISVSGQPAVIFSMADVQAGRLVYTHDDTDSSRDRIELRISDGHNTVLSSFPITVIPRDDTAPYLVTNLGLQLNEGATRRLSQDMLMAHDTDSLDENIIYTVVSSPTAGDIIRKIRPSDSGTKVFGFRQRDVLKGQIYYRHHGNEVFKDSFTFTLQDHQEPPNESEAMEFEILVTPMNENPPQIDPDAKRILYVAETDVAYIKPAELRYTDVESTSGSLRYTVTTPPYFVYNRGEKDAGRLVATHNISKLDKDTKAPKVVTFTQADIDHLKIAYIPPKTDIGPESRLVRLAYTVEDSSGNKLYGQTFDIEVNPVNNRVPEFVTDKLLVEEGGILGITMGQLSATDLDTPVSMLKFILDAPPRFGTLQNDGRMLRQGSSFIIEDLTKKLIRYLHDGSDVVLDTFTLALTDGTNQATKVISIQIVPIDDQTPTLSKNLRPQLIVSEGEEATITSRILAATDEDTDDESLVFLIVRQPKYGVLQLRGQPATKFTQEDVKDEKVTFLHTSGEIGTNAVKDIASFIISDQNYLASADMPMYDLNITITPVNNQKPVILLGSPVFVAEGESFRFSEEVLKVSDPDSKTKEIQFLITSQPRWGYIENTKPSPGSEKLNTGVRVNAFKYGDILDGSINYVQANHKGVEPVMDQLEFYASDGKLNSDMKKIKITIVPSNDEIPDLMLNHFSVVEGGEVTMGPSILDAIDMDVPRDLLKLSISQAPAHGQVLMKIPTRRGTAESQVEVLGLEELRGGNRLIYRHDGSEVFTDKFAITVSDGKHEIKKVCNVSIKLHNDERPEVQKNAGLELDYGDSALVSSVVLQANDDDNDDEELTYLLVEIPAKGFLQYCPDPQSQSLELDCRDLALGENFTQTDVDLNHIRYIHTTSMGSTETDRFVFVLTDGTHKRHEETFEIRIRNSKKANIAVLNKGMVVREGERVAISTNNLSASDESTRGAEIVFAVIRPPRLGQIEHIKRRFVPISSFTQLDIASQRVVYNHLTKNDIVEDSFTFTVTNGLSEAKDGEFHINIQPMDRVLPSLIANTLLEVVQGTEKPVTPVHLKATDPDTAAHNITYHVAKPPTFGRLYNRGVAVTSSFTQNDVDLGHITYQSDHSRAGLDNFLFTVSDSRHEGFLLNGSLQNQPSMFSIFVQPLVEDAPRLVVNKSPELLQHLGRRRYGYKLTSKMLRAVDSDSDSSSIWFVMTSRPKYGHLENTVAKRYVRRRFTQQDLDSGSLLYIVNQKSNNYHDSFTFRVEDMRGNVLAGQRFEMSWSRVEFGQEEVVVCENIGTLNIPVSRTGSLEQSAFVSMHIREMSTKRGQDFVPSTAKQIQFDPGASRATWSLTIPDDGLMEPNEKLRLSLVEPINTMLGEKRKLRVVIINAENGECPQYLGMISKYSNGEEMTVGSQQGRPIPTAGDSRDQVTLFHNIGNIPLSNGFDNAFLNTEAEKKSSMSETSSPSSPVTSLSGSGKGKRRKNRRRRKGKKRKNRRKRKRNGRKSEVILPSPSSAEVDITSPSSNGLTRPQGTAVYQVPKKCTAETKGFLHFDDFHYQLLKCDGDKWEPWSPNSSNDGATSQACQQGWVEYEGRCYRPVDERLSWDDAEHKCQIMFNGHLTSVGSIRQLRWLVERMNGKAFWIGLNDKAENGNWVFTSGDPVTVLNWKMGKPRVRRMPHKKNCVVVKKRAKWRNKHCNKYQARYVCEAPLNQDHDSAPRNSRRMRKGHSRRGAKRQRQAQRAHQNHEGFFFGNS
ncbi:FRAS1-related extracellular matrix protein 1 [Aplysia californica]|uniref:FRAS1-related extracellular matrix protein 1 n=1 Tax=Aplysia californica TaxID=6500 RepID=A0ABM1VVJ9_APLCA|nr:FRAS1-related extracellular matrix protein 1 [Aplysia californica]